MSGQEKAIAYVEKEGARGVTQSQGRHCVSVTTPTMKCRVTSDLPLIGYLFHCLMTGAWRGSVWVPGSSLSHRLPSIRHVALMWPA